MARKLKHKALTPIQCVKGTSIRNHALYKLLFLIMSLSILSTGGLSAQWLIYGTGGDGAKFVSSAPSPEYTDDVRYSVSSYSNSTTGAGPYVNTLTITTGSGYGTFSSGDRILIVDMDASCSGRNYDLAIINTGGVSGATITATCAVTNVNHVHIVGGSKTHTQVLRIPQWSSVSFATSSDVLTCHSWDPVTGTGGILAFNCNGTLDLSIGTINTVGKGAVGANSVAGGAAASNCAVSTYGGIAATSPAADGSSAHCSTIGNVSNGNGGVGLSESCNGNIFGGSGGCGDHAIDGQGPYPGILTYGFCVSDYSKLYFNIGNAGRSGLSGQGAGAGGNGGGGGGGLYARGASSPYAMDGGQGQNPSGHPAGGQGGLGGDGGGSIYIKAYDIMGPAGATPAIISHGSTAGNGVGKTLSDKGGDGGTGGRGGDAGCNGRNFFAPGGGGGFGEAGNGPDGGAGGDGGNGGSIWIEYYTSSSFSATNLDASGGSPGLGGVGGPPGTNGSQGANGGLGSIRCSTQCGSSPVCTALTWLETYPAGNPNGCVSNDCDCDNAFRVLADMQHIISNVGSGGTQVVTYGAPLTGSSRNYCIKRADGLWAYEYVITTAGGCNAPGTATLHIYHCPLIKCSLPFWTSIAPPVGHVSGTTVIWPTIGSYASNVITDLVNHQSCTAKCDGGGGGGGGGGGEPQRPRWGYNGSNGSTGHDGGTSIAPSADPNFDYSGDPAKPVVLSNITNHKVPDIKELNIMPNPASSHLDINFSSLSDNKYVISIVDITGKEVYKEDYTSKAGKNVERIDVKALAAGTYIINIGNNEGKQQVKFVKE